MATRAQIDRLAQRIEALVGRKPLSPAHTIIVDGEPEDAARERHYRANPQHRGAPAILIHVVDPQGRG